MEEHTSYMAESEQKPAEETANAAMRTAQRVKEKLEKRREVEDWSSRMYTLLAPRRVLESMAGASVT